MKGIVCPKHWVCFGRESIQLLSCNRISEYLPPRNTHSMFDAFWGVLIWWGSSFKGRGLIKYFIKTQFETKILIDVYLKVRYPVQFILVILMYHISCTTMKGSRQAKFWWIGNQLQGLSLFGLISNLLGELFFGNFRRVLIWEEYFLGGGGHKFEDGQYFLLKW